MTKRKYAIGVAMAVLAFMINYFLGLDLYGVVTLHFGSALVLLALLMLPLPAATLVAIASLAPLFLFAESNTFAWLALSEYLVIALLVQAGIRFLFALSLFWLAVGLPLGTFLVYSELCYTVQTSIFLSVSFSMSGFICGAIAIIAYWLLPATSQLRRYDTPPKFSRLMFELNLISVLLPIFLVTLFFTWRTANDAAVTVNVELDRASQSVERSIDTLLQGKLHALDATAYLVGKQDDIDEKAKILDSVANASINLESMVIADEYANVLIAAPAQYAAILPDLSDISLSHRKYFQLTKANKQAVVSDALKGSGLGSLDIIALTAPILKNNDFKGLVQAAITLESVVDTSLIDSIENRGMYIVVVDSAGSIIYSSAEFTFNKLDTFTVNAKDADKYSFNIPEIDIQGKSYLHKERQIANNWRVLVLKPSNTVFIGTNTYFIFVATIVLMSIMLVGILAQGLANRIMRPLLSLLAFFNGQKAASTVLTEAKISRETLSVAEKVIAMNEHTETKQQKLQKQLDDNFNEIQGLNQELLKASTTDALTGLFNRIGFDQLAQSICQNCQEHKQSFTIVLFDIDHFKMINDTYGQTAGDVCIVDVAEIIQGKCHNESTVAARCGGEEFILLLSNDNAEQHIELIQTIHRTIARHKPLYNNKMIDLTVSCAVVHIEKDFSKELSAIIAMADECMFKSKQGGGDQIQSVSI